MGFCGLFPEPFGTAFARAMFTELLNMVLLALEKSRYCVILAYVTGEIE
jgi:hypothetical protein